MPADLLHPARSLAPGETIGSYEWHPTTIQLFRFSAVTWNQHRIHYDQAYARDEGYPDVLVQSHLHGCYLAHSLLAWAGPGARLVNFRWENRHYAVPDGVLTVTGTVTEVDGNRVTVELQEVNQDGRLCAPAWATVEFAPASDGIAA